MSTPLDSIPTGTEMHAFVPGIGSFPVKGIDNGDGTATVVTSATLSGGNAGSVTAAGTNGTTAQAVQGITGGVPQPVSIASSSSSTSNSTTPSMSTTSAVLLAANANRKGFVITNTLTGNLIIGDGFVPTTSVYTYKIPPGKYRVPDPCLWQGVMNALVDAGSGAVNVTEYS